MGRGGDLTPEEREVIQNNCVSFRKELARDLGREVSQQELADMAGLSLDTIRGYEQGRRVPDRKGLMLLSQVYGRAIEDFFSASPPPPDPSRRIAVRAKIVGPLDTDLRDRVLDFISEVNREQFARAKKLRPKKKH
jgi:transcriptional regulator with XRE-family HTH domain